MWPYKLGDWYAPPVAPFRMMVVDVSPCGRFVTLAARHNTGGVLEVVLTRPSPDVGLLPRYRTRG
jgi:hypothetical protein